MTKKMDSLRRTVAAALGLVVLAGPASAQNLEKRVAELEAQLSAVTDAVDQAPSSGGDDRLSIGAYGELHYNNLENDATGDRSKEFDFHRFVLFFGYEFEEGLRFVSEFELEHALAGEGKGGEVELEQAYIELAHGDDATQFGVFLVPVGILNETHEPPTFYGVERNPVENIIIPATWWEAGVQHIQRFGEGWEWNVAVHSGLEIPTTGGSTYRIRSGRQKVSNADGNHLAITNRIKYTGIQGLELAATFQRQSDPTQTSNDGLDEGTLIEAHAIYNNGPFSLRALFADWSFDGAGIEAAGVDSQSGWYVEPGYKITNEVGVYLRAAEVEGARPQDNFEQMEVGVNWWLHEKAVLKFDFRDVEHTLAGESGRDFSGFDLGVGYQF